MTRQERNRKYYLENKGKIRAYQVANRERIREYFRIYDKTPARALWIKENRKKNGAKHAVYELNRYRNMTPEQKVSRRRVQMAWYRRNPDKVNISANKTYLKRRLFDRDGLRLKGIRAAHLRRARRHSFSDGTFTLEAIQRLFNEVISCPYCGIALTKANRHLDHKEPLSRGGLHSLSNITPCCKSCNQKKSNKPYNQWLNEIESLACPA